MKEDIVKLITAFDYGEATETETADKILDLFSVSGCLPPHQEMRDRLEYQFFKDYNGFDKAKRFYFKRGWRMCYQWIKENTNNR